MGTEHVRSFLNSVSNDPSLKARAEKMNWEQVHHLAVEQGHGFSLDDLLGVVRQGGELSDGELDNVAGGAPGSNQVFSIQTAGAPVSYDGPIGENNFVDPSNSTLQGVISPSIFFGSNSVGF